LSSFTEPLFVSNNCLLKGILDVSDTDCELHFRAVEHARKIAKKLIHYMDVSSSPSLKNLEKLYRAYRSLVFGDATNAAYFNFGNPVAASIIANGSDGGSIVVKIVPVRTLTHFENIYGISLDQFKELVKKGIIIPVIEHPVAVFSETDPEIWGLIESVVRDGRIPGYILEHVALQIEEGIHYGLKLSQYIDRIKEYSYMVKWYCQLGYNPSHPLPAYELLYTTYTTYLDMSLSNTKIIPIVIKMIKKGDIENLMDYLYLYSTFTSDRIWLSPNNRVIADLDDIREVLKKSNKINKIYGNLGPVSLDLDAESVKKTVFLEVGVRLWSEFKRARAQTNHKSKYIFQVDLTDLSEILESARSMKTISRKIDDIIERAKKEELSPRDLSEIEEDLGRTVKEIVKSLSKSSRRFNRSSILKIAVPILGVAGDIILTAFLSQQVPVPGLLSEIAGVLVTSIELLYPTRSVGISSRKIGISLEDLFPGGAFIIETDWISKERC